MGIGITQCVILHRIQTCLADAGRPGLRPEIPHCAGFAPGTHVALVQSWDNFADIKYIPCAVIMMGDESSIDNLDLKLGVIRVSLITIGAPWQINYLPNYLPLRQYLVMIGSRPPATRRTERALKYLQKWAYDSSQLNLISEYCVGHSQFPLESVEVFIRLIAINSANTNYIAVLSGAFLLVPVSHGVLTIFLPHLSKDTSCT